VRNVSGRVSLHEGDFLRAVSAASASRGYSANKPFSSQLTLSRRVVPTFAKVLAVCLFPIGLVALFAKTDRLVIVEYVSDHQGTAFTLNATNRLAKAIQANLQADWVSSEF
jgi:hypothetical protein